MGPTQFEQAREAGERFDRAGQEGLNEGYRGLEHPHSTVAAIIFALVIVVVVWGAMLWVVATAWRDRGSWLRWFSGGG